MVFLLERIRILRHHPFLQVVGRFRQHQGCFEAYLGLHQLHWEVGEVGCLVLQLRPYFAATVARLLPFAAVTSTAAWQTAAIAAVRMPDRQASAELAVRRSQGFSLHIAVASHHRPLLQSLKLHQAPSVASRNKFPWHA